MASIFEISPFLHYLTTAMAAWTAAMANPAGMVILAPLGKGKDDRKEFPVIVVIVTFGGKKGSRKVGTGMEIAVDVCLEQNSSCSEWRGIGHDREWASNIRNGQNGLRGKGSLEGVECALLERGPGPQLVFPGEEVKWGDNMGEVGDKFVIEVCKPEE